MDTQKERFNAKHTHTHTRARTKKKLLRIIEVYVRQERLPLAVGRVRSIFSHQFGTKQERWEGDKTRKHEKNYARSKK